MLTEAPLLAAGEFELDPEHIKEMEQEIKNAENAPIDDADEDI
jgi:hypothetical protein